MTQLNSVRGQVLRQANRQRRSLHRGGSLAMDINQSYGVNEVALVLDAAEVFDGAGFAVARLGAPHASSAARSTIRAVLLSGVISRMATVPSLMFCFTKLGLPGLTKSTPW